jgi:thioredoxin-like negative regulator of GroEL
MKFSSLNFLLFASLLFFGLVSAKETEHEKAERLRLATEADSHIKFIELDVLDSSIQKGTWIIFYGAKWCKFTQKFTPHFLRVQERIAKEVRIRAGVRFDMRKVECSVNESFCTDQHKIVGYPTIILYKNGKQIEEYVDADEEEPFFQYVKKVIHQADIERKGSTRELFTENPIPLSNDTAALIPEARQNHNLHSHEKDQSIKSFEFTSTRVFLFGFFVVLGGFIGLKLFSRHDNHRARYESL